MAEAIEAEGTAELGDNVPTAPPVGWAVGQLELHVSDQISEDEMFARAAYFPGPTQSLTSEDFDSRSVHIVFRHGNSIAAYIRLTEGPPGVFRTWSRGAAMLTEGPDVADLSRCFVHHRYRRLELLRAVYLAGLLEASQRSMRLVNTVYTPGRYLAGTLRDIGFANSSNECTSFEPNGNTRICQPMTCDLLASRALRADQWERCERHLASNGFTIGLRHERFQRQPQAGVERADCTAGAAVAS